MLPDYVIIEFESLKEAEDMRAALQNLWKKVDGKIIFSPKTRILKLTESKDI